jgi:hypothetical protein
MSDHKFAVGQNVEFSPDWPIDDTTKGQYTIVRLYPETGNTPQYRVKSKRDGHERMVQEDRLDRLLDPAPDQEQFCAGAQQQAVAIGTTGGGAHCDTLTEK